MPHRPRSKFFTVRVTLPEGLDLPATAPREVDIETRKWFDAMQMAHAICAEAASPETPVGTTVTVLRDDATVEARWQREEGGWRYVGPQAKHARPRDPWHPDPPVLPQLADLPTLPAPRVP